MTNKKRLFLIASRFAAVVVFLIGLLLTGNYYLGETVRSYCWHLIHGNTVVFQGHKMILPPTWREDRSREDKIRALHLTRAVLGRPLFWSGMLIIYSPAPGNNGIVNNASAQGWQKDTIALANSRSTRHHLVPETIPTRSLTFYCVHDPDDIKHDGHFCRVGGTDWLVSFDSSNEAREILKSME